MTRPILRHCVRCDHYWLPRVLTKPKKCPKCSDPKWETARTFPQRRRGDLPDLPTCDDCGERIQAWRVKGGSVITREDGSETCLCRDCDADADAIDHGVRREGE